jgi:hypothetical protein
MNPNGNGLAQFGLGVAIFNAIFGLPVCVLLAMNYPLIAYIAIPILAGVPVLTMLLRTNPTDKPVPKLLVIYMILFFLQMCCGGWMLTMYFANPSSPESSRISWVLIWSFFAFFIARKLVGVIYRKNSMPQNGSS